MKKHHAQKRSHKSHDETGLESAKQAGFLSFKDLMNRNDKIIITLIIIGIASLVTLSIFIIINQSPDSDEELSNLNNPSTNISKAPYPTVAKEIKDTTILINNRGILPQTVTIQAGGTVGFFNEDTTPITIQGANNASSILNVGSVAPYDIPVVKFDKPGKYTYLNPNNPDYIAEIIVEE